MAAGTIIFYDSDCLLCLASVRFVLRHDRSRSIYFSSFQSDAARSLAVVHKIDMQQPQSIIFLQHGRIYQKSDAVIQIANNFGFLFKSIQLLRFVPTKWRDGFYDLIAENRRRFFRKNSSCFIPHRKILNRFLG